MLAKPAGGQACNVLFTGCSSEVDPTFLETVENLANQVRQTEGGGHVRVSRTRELPQIIEVSVRQNERLQVVLERRAPSRLHGHQMHKEKGLLLEE